MKKLIVILLLVLSFDTVSQANLKFFDRKMIVKYKISKLYEMISDDKRDSKDWIPCPNYYYMFDKKGNIVGEGLGRVPTTVGYKYNDEDELIDIFWQEHRTGKIELYFSQNEHSIQNPIEFKNRLKETEKRLVLMLRNKKSYNSKPFFKVTDSCAMINAEYILTLIDGDELPVSFKADFKRELDTSLTPKKPISPKLLYIYYDYEFYN